MAKRFSVVAPNVKDLSRPSSHSRKRRALFIAAGLALTSTLCGRLSADDVVPVKPEKSSGNAAVPAQMSGARAASRDSFSAPVVMPAAKKETVETTPATPDDMKGGDRAATVKISGAKFKGNTVFDEATLKNVLSDDIPGKLNFNRILLLARKVEDFYRDNGYGVTKVIVPKQEIGENGVLTIQVLEGRVGKVNISGNKRYSTERVSDTVNAFVETGKPFTISEIERPLVLLNSRSGISVGSTLSPGAETGTTDINVVVEEQRRISGSVEVNNFGSDDSGKYRVIPAFALPNTTGVGDELSAFGVLTPDEIDTWAWQANYTRPLGVYGTAFNVYGGMGNNVVGNEYAVLDINGDSYSWGAGFSQKVVFSANTSLDLQLWFEWADMSQDMLGIRTTDDAVRKIRVGANLDHTDSWGRTIVSLHLHQGLGNVLGAMDNNDPYSSRAYAQADNRFTKIVFGLMRTQYLLQRVYGLFNFTGQYSVDPLVSGEQIYSGGANSVRGQPYSYFSGDDGYFVNAELRFVVVQDIPRIQVAAFVDFAQTHIKTPVIGQKSWNSLGGAGLGLRAELVKGLDVRFDAAVPVGAKRGDDYYLYGQVRYSF